ncbi:MAG TPA: PAS domain-containing protein [Rhodocyclaceae bacterium]|nr:PAS domain-containing protein [Rhodocyclaceae bacterium]
MATLRQLFSHWRHRGGPHLPPAPGQSYRPERRRTDRRSSDRSDPGRESRWHFAAQAAGLGLYDLDCASGEVHWSPELKAIAGLPPDDAAISLERIAELLHPDDRHRVMEKIKASLSGEGSPEFEDEHRLLRPDGSIRWVKAKGRTFLVAENGRRRPVGASGVVMDITENRTYQEALRRSRKELALAVRGAAIGTWNWDMRSGEMLWSDRCRQLFGIPLDEPMTFDLFLGALEPDEREPAKTAISQALEKREEYNLEHRIRWPDGSRHWIAVVGRGHYDDSNGEVIGMSGIALDITARKEMEESLRESEELMRLANEAADIGTYDTDLETGRTRLSPQLCAILGFTPCPDLDIEQSANLIHPEDREHLLALFQRSLDPAGDGLVHSEHRVVRADGQVRWLVWRGQTIFRDRPAGRVAIRHIGACFDITERKRLEEALQRMNQDLEQRVEERTAQLLGANEALIRSNLELQQFTYVAAHDLQTPLRSISGFAQLLQQEFRGRINDQADLWIGQLVHHVERMHELIQDLLIYSGVDSPGRPFELTDFRELFDAALASLREDIARCGATVTRGELPTLMGDRIQLAQVMHHLIDNGIKYRGQEPPRVHVAAERQEDEWLFSVRDNGIGIDKKHHRRIFEIFRRLHSQQAYPGTGIGLAICRRVVQRHGGQIWVESEPGRGSTFYFTLPDGAPGPTGQAAK